MPAFKVIFHNAGDPGERQGRLGEVVSWVCLYSVRIFCQLLPSGMRTNQHPIPTRLSGYLNDKPIEIVQNIGSILRIAAQIGGHIGQNRFLPEVVFDDLRHVSIDDLVIRDASSRSVGKSYPSL